MKTLAVFDFDGTITRRDTLLEFIKFAKGKLAFYVGFAIHLPWLMAMKLHLYPNWKTKQLIFSYYFKGMKLETFDKVCQQFFEEKGKSLLYQDAVRCIHLHLDHGDEVVIISASIDNWVRPFAQYLGVGQLLATQLEIDSSEKRLSGRFVTANCYGREKVKRLCSLYPSRHEHQIVAYGDSRGDREILEYADEAFFKKFRK